MIRFVLLYHFFLFRNSFVWCLIYAICISWRTDPVTHAFKVSICVFQKIIMLVLNIKVYKLPSLPCIQEHYLIKYLSVFSGKSLSLSYLFLSTNIVMLYCYLFCLYYSIFRVSPLCLYIILSYRFSCFFLKCIQDNVKSTNFCLSLQ